MNSLLLRPMLRSVNIVLQNDIKVIPQLYTRTAMLQARFCSGETKKADASYTPSRKREPERDRRIPVEIETSMRYLQSDEFQETYKGYKIWELFRRNFPGQHSPVKPRINCIDDEGWVMTSNPCVVCRDRNLVIGYKNIDLLKHFISPHTGYVYPNTVLCLCSEQYEKLCVAVTLAKNYGLIDFDLPPRQYNYHHHYEKLPANFLE